MSLPATDDRTMSLEAFLAWTDEDVWAEWVAGEVVPFSPASYRHQDLARFLISLLSLWCEERRLGVLLPAPFAMVLEEQDRVREPDLVFVAEEHRERLGESRLEGPADLAVEIVSPESVARDRGEKFVEYEAAGVREYWLIDPRRQQVEVHHLGEDGRYRTMPLEDGAIVSPVLDGLRLPVAWLWRSPLPRVLEAASALGLGA